MSNFQSLKKREPPSLRHEQHFFIMALTSRKLLKLHEDIRQVNLQFYHNVQDKFRTAVLRLLLRSVQHHHDEIRSLFYQEFQSARSLVEERAAAYLLLTQSELEVAARTGVVAYREIQAAMHAQKTRNMGECMHLYNVSFSALQMKVADVVQDPTLVNRVVQFVKEQIYSRMRPMAF